MKQVVLIFLAMFSTGCVRAGNLFLDGSETGIYHLRAGEEVRLFIGISDPNLQFTNPQQTTTPPELLNVPVEFSIRSGHAYGSIDPQIDLTTSTSHWAAAHSRFTAGSVTQEEEVEIQAKVLGMTRRRTVIVHPPAIIGSAESNRWGTVVNVRAHQPREGDTFVIYQIKQVLGPGSKLVNSHICILCPHRFADRRYPYSYRFGNQMRMSPARGVVYLMRLVDANCQSCPGHDSYAVINQE